MYMRTAERTGLSVVGVHDDVVACLADRGLQVVEKLRVEPDQLGHAGEHAAHERQRLRPGVELKADGRRVGGSSPAILPDDRSRWEDLAVRMLLSFVCGVNLCPVMDSRVRALYKIEAQPEGPAQARRIIAEELSTVLSPGELDDVKLMVSELVTNGIVHGRLEPDDVPVMLDLCVNGDIRCARARPWTGFCSRASSEHDARLGPAAGRATVRPLGDASVATAHRSMVRTQLRMKSRRAGRPPVHPCTTYTGRED